MGRSKTDAPRLNPTDLFAGGETKIRPEDNDVLIERQRMELFQPQSLTDQYLADLDDLDDRCIAPLTTRTRPPCPPQLP